MTTILSEDVWYRIVHKVHPLEAMNLCPVSSTLYHNVILPILRQSTHKLEVFSDNEKGWENHMQFNADRYWHLTKRVKKTIAEILSQPYYICISRLLYKYRYDVCDYLLGKKLINPIDCMAEVLSSDVDYLIKDKWLRLIMRYVQPNRLGLVRELLTAHGKMYVASEFYMPTVKTPKMLYSLAMSGNATITRYLTSGSLEAYTKHCKTDILDWKLLHCCIISSCSDEVLDWYNTTIRLGRMNNRLDRQNAIDYMKYALMSGDELRMTRVWNDYMAFPFESPVVDTLVEFCGEHTLTSGIEFLSSVDALPEYYTCQLMSMVAQQLSEKPRENNPIDSYLTIDLYGWIFNNGMIPSYYDWESDNRQNDGKYLAKTWYYLLKWLSNTGLQGTDLNRLLELTRTGLRLATYVRYPSKVQREKFWTDVDSLNLPQSLLEYLDNNNICAIRQFQPINQ